jgi:hypothetical protein
MTTWKAAIIPPGGHMDPLAQTGLLVIQFIEPNGERKALMSDGTWAEVVEGTSNADIGIALPGDAIVALVEALDRYKGSPTNSKTEAAVLREWLTYERDRVDSVLLGEVKRHAPQG